MKPRHMTIAMVGVTLVGVLAGSASGQTDGSPQRGGIDAKPYLAQGIAQGPLQAILLQRMQASCPAETKRAVMVDRRAPIVWFGCWRERDGKVEIVFEDGDFLALEHDGFVWLPDTGA
jgi:hypothetical protein